MKYIYIIVLVLGFCAVDNKASGQSPGSTTTHHGIAISTGTIQADAAETIYIGPGAYEINGIWEIYSKYVVIDPQAIISGTGMIKFNNSMDAGGSASPTFIDGNASSNSIAVNLVHNNPDGIQLADIPFPLDLVSDGFTNNSAASSLYIAKDLDLAVDGGNVTLGISVVGDLVLTNDASISNFGVNRMIITSNSTLSHLVKNLTNDSFTFPVGIAKGDYTPASISATGNYHVSVQNYSVAIPVITEPEEGIDRTWHVYSDAISTADVTLIHNISTNGSSYNDANAFITQYQGAAWSTSATTDFVSGGVHRHASLAILASSSDNGSWFTKSSDKTSPLPVTLISFNARKIENNIVMNWITSSERNASHFKVERSTDARNFEAIGHVSAKGTNNGNQEYSFIDSTFSFSSLYYRLRLVDNDATFSFSGIRNVVLENSPPFIKVYPNPVSHFLHVEAQNMVSFGIINSIGQNIYTSTKGVSESVDIRSLPNGIYLVNVLQKNGFVKSTKIMIMK